MTEPLNPEDILRDLVAHWLRGSFEDFESAMRRARAYLKRRARQPAGGDGDRDALHG